MDKGIPDKYMSITVKALAGKKKQLQSLSGTLPLFPMAKEEAQMQVKTSIQAGVGFGLDPNG